MQNLEHGDLAPKPVDLGLQLLDAPNQVSDGDLVAPRYRIRPDLVHFAPHIPKYGPSVRIVTHWRTLVQMATVHRIHRFSPGYGNDRASNHASALKGPPVTQSSVTITVSPFSIAVS